MAPSIAPTRASMSSIVPTTAAMSKSPALGAAVSARPASAGVPGEEGAGALSAAGAAGRRKERREAGAGAGVGCDLRALTVSMSQRISPFAASIAAWSALIWSLTGCWPRFAPARSLLSASTASGNGATVPVTLCTPSLQSPIAVPAVKGRLPCRVSDYKQPKRLGDPARGGRGTMFQHAQC